MTTATTQEAAESRPPSVLGVVQQAMLDAEYDNMLSCVRCGLCLTSCPTYVLSLHEAEGPRGRVAMARALAEGHLAITPDLIEHEQNCLICDACSAVCPAGVHMDPLQVALRTAIEPHIRRPLWQRTVRAFVFRRLFPNMRLFRLVVRLLWLYQRLGAQALVRRLGLLKLLRLNQPEAFLPAIDRQFLIPRGEVYPAATEQRSGHDYRRDLPQSSVLDPAVNAQSSPVSFFAGCVMSTALAGIDRATIRVLQRAGHAVINTAGQGCCGALNGHGGDLATAREMARRNIVAFERDGDTPIVVNAAGCGAMLKDYAHHFSHDPTWAVRAKAFSARVKDVTEFLAERTSPPSASSGPHAPPPTTPSAVQPSRPTPRSTGSRTPWRGEGEPRQGGGEVHCVITFQDPCHLAHAQRIQHQPRTLLKALPGIELREMAESTLCCGSAGIYNVTNPVESRQLQQRKLDNALATGAEVIVTANPGCLLQLQAGLTERGSRVRVKHIVEVLDEVAGTSPPNSRSTPWRGGGEVTPEGAP